MCCEGKDLKTIPRDELEVAIRFHHRLGHLLEEQITDEPLDDLFMRHYIRFSELNKLGQERFGVNFVSETIYRGFEMEGSYE